METQVLKNIKMFRDLAGLSQTEMSEKMNLTQSAYARFELGKTETDLAKVVTFAKALNIPLQDVIFYPEKLINIKEIGLHQEENVSITMEVRNEKKQKVLEILFGESDLKILNR